MNPLIFTGGFCNYFFDCQPQIMGILTPGSAG
jgi:hypothetical protein